VLYKTKIPFAWNPSNPLAPMKLGEQRASKQSRRRDSIPTPSHGIRKREWGGMGEEIDQDTKQQQPCSPNGIEGI
jgi:hypothetical protein